MAKSSRDKGMRGQRQAAKVWSDFTLQEYKSTASQPAGAIFPDILRVDGQDPFWVEVKVGKAPPIRAAMAQAVRDTQAAGGKRIPLALTREDHEEWLLTMRLSDHSAFLEAFTRGILADIANMVRSDCPSTARPTESNTEDPE